MSDLNGIEKITISGANLTSREQEILKHLLEGISAKEIAHKINISVKTLDTHRTNIYRKLDVHSYKELLKKYSPENRLLDHPQISEHFNKTNKRFKILIPAIIMNLVISAFFIVFLFLRSDTSIVHVKLPQEISAQAPVFIDRTFRILNFKSSRWNNIDNGSYGQTYSSSHSIKLKDFYTGSFDDLVPNAFEWHTLRISGISEMELKYVKFNIFLVPYGGGDWIIVGGGDNSYVNIGPGFFSEEIQINKFYNETPEFPAGEIIFELGANLFSVMPDNPGFNFDTGLRIPENVPNDRIITYIRNFKIEPVLN